MPGLPLGEDFMMANNDIPTRILPATGESVALECLEVVSVPHIGIFGDRDQSDPGIEARHAKETRACLGEVFQLYRDAVARGGIGRDISLELLFLTQPVPNQPFAASVRMFILARAIEASAESAARVAAAALSPVRSLLLSQKYELQEMPMGELSALVARINDDVVLAVQKSERVVNLQSAVMPFAYAYDRLLPSQDGLSRVVNALASHPYSALSVQLIPTSLEYEEAIELDRNTQFLDMLERGVTDPGAGSVSFALASAPAEVFRFYSERKTAPLFNCNVLVYGTQEAARDIASRMMARLDTGASGIAGIKTVEVASSIVDKDNNFFPLPWAVGEYLADYDRNEVIWSSGQFPPSLYRLPLIFAVEEAAELFKLPIGSDSLSVGVAISRAGRQSRTYASNLINAGDITLGRLRSSGGFDTIGISLSDLAKHMLVVGTPGSGKTTFSVGLLDRLWKEHGVPFLVIEPAKNEYRALIQSIPDLQVFTPGKSTVSPFVYNPFVPPKGVRLETHKTTLKTAFAAGVSMTTPLDKLFEETIDTCYSDFRWLDTYTSEDGGRIFNIADFIKCFQKTFERIGYRGDASNIGKAGIVRLKSLERLFDNYHSIPVEDLLSRPTVIELAAIENGDQKALIVALLLLSILAYVNANYLGQGGLRNVILLEEAHVLLDGGGNVGQGDSNPTLIAQGLVKRMLAEIRSYGVGMIIADQSPRKVTTDVVALTDMKAAFRLVESSDRQILGESIGMTESEMVRLGKLQPGEAFLFFNRLEDPEEIVTPNYRLENKIDISLSDKSVASLSTYWSSRQEQLRPYPECDMCACCKHSCDHARRVLAREVARRLFVRKIQPVTSDENNPEATKLEPLNGVTKQIVRLVKGELNGEPFSHELLLCVKVHLYRRVRYETQIPLTEALIEKSLTR